MRSAFGSTFLKYTHFRATDQSPGPLLPTLGLGNECTNFYNSCRMQSHGRTAILIDHKKEHTMIPLNCKTGTTARCSRDTPFLVLKCPHIVVFLQSMR